MKAIGFLLVIGGIFYYLYQGQQERAKFLANAGCDDPTFTKAQKILCLAHNAKDSASSFDRSGEAGGRIR